MCEGAVEVRHRSVGAKPVAETGKRAGRRSCTLTRSKVCVRQRVALLWVRGWDFDRCRSARGHMGDVEYRRRIGVYGNVW